ncbi:MAG: ROK family protein [Microbacteriaceae bacterium]|nr:ROK family protein [Microbacteriaceae bacterium]
MTATAIGIDIGGTGIKGAIVNVATGELVTDRKKLPTPKKGKPDDILNTVLELFEQFGEVAAGTPVGVCFPSIVIHGRTMSAANVSKKWIGLEAEKMFEKTLGRGIHFVNDADAAGVAEVRYGAAVDIPGLTILTTLGTGIGSAMLFDGELIPNSELGHLQLDGRDAEKLASTSAKENEDLSWKEWAKRLQRYYEHVELLFSPDLILVGGGISKSSEEFLPLLTLRTPIKPAALRNNAGIVGAAALAAQ